MDAYNEACLRYLLLSARVKL